MADVGSGATITFGSTFFAELTSISHSGMERAEIETTHLNSSNARSFMPGDLYNPGETKVDVLWNADTNGNPFTLLTATTTSIVITFPVPSGRTTGAKFTGTGFLKSFEVNVPLEDRMTGSGVVKWTGTVAYTSSA